MIKKLLQKIIEKRITYGFKFGGYSDYPDVGKIYDSDVYELVMAHSRFIDRLSPVKMVEMSILSQHILFGIYKKIKPDDFTWTFYGKNALYKWEDWG